MGKEENESKNLATIKLHESTHDPLIDPLTEVALFPMPTVFIVEAVTVRLHEVKGKEVNTIEMQNEKN